MSEKPKDESGPPRPAKSTEYGDAISDVLKDQVRRDKLRSAATPKPSRTRVHPSIPLVLALLLIWLWAFPPAALLPDVPTISPARQEAGLRMEMFTQRAHILRYQAEYGSLPDGLDQVGGRPVGVEYTRLANGVFQLSGTAGDITVNYTSTQPEEDLLGDAIGIVSGRSSTPGGEGAW